MAVFKRMSQEEIKRDFTHLGLMFGFVPVYVGDLHGISPRVAVRNWWPEFLLDFAEGFTSALNTFFWFFDPYYEPMFSIKVTGKL